MSRLGNSKILKTLALSWVSLSRFFHKRIIVNALFLGGVILLGQGIYMDAKAIVAQGLIAHSWQQRTAGSPPPTPWWWADTKAVAKLDVPRLKKQLFVMQDDSGESLAFGPGHLNTSAEISKEGHVMIAGHRDSHFKFLQQLEVGDVIETTSHDYLTAQYRVKEMRILNASDEQLMRYDENQLTLITCYPFEDFIPGGPLRYIVEAEHIDTPTAIF